MADKFDINSIMEMLSGDNLNGIGESLGLSSDQISSVIQMSVPQLLNGMKENSSTEEGAASLEQALLQHVDADTSDVSAFLASADTEDGAKIVDHILGKEGAETATGEISEQTGLSLGNVASIMGSVAPFLMSLLGQQNSSSQAQTASSGGGGIGSLLGGLLDQDGNGLDLGDISSMASTLMGGETTSTGKKKKKKKKKKNDSGLLGSLLDLFR
ncbi:MAG: DUF937 domain-containing protein [Lachnospiraceae bacterium]|nr:DUF937 domain-containing protein [Lachnospiraceae bacterium]